jgi:hypothetical protein
MKRIMYTLAIALCVTGILSGNLEARHTSHDHAVSITGREIRELERTGHLATAGKDAWKTRAGLLIAGRDPDGRTRLEHIMRHAADSPRRHNHGVFALTKAGIIKLMDETWMKIRQGTVSGNERGGKIAYTVRLGRPVGYLGGRKGRERGHPKLDVVRLVIKKGTAAVITFFPM